MTTKRRRRHSPEQIVREQRDAGALDALATKQLGRKPIAGIRVHANSQPDEFFNEPLALQN